MLYETSRGENKFYLLGTYHFGIAAADRHPEMAKISRLVLEINPQTLVQEEEEVVELRERYAFSDVPLDERFTGGTWEALLELLGLDEEGAASIRYLQPWALMQPLFSSTTEDAACMDLELSKESTLFRSNRPITVVGLETYEFQLRLMSSTNDEFVEFFEDLVQGGPDSARRQLPLQLGLVNKLYKAGKGRAIYRLFKSSSSPLFGRRFVEDRNQRWLSVLEEENDSLVAVGALHLFGPEGLIALLQQRHWSVRRLS